MSSMSVTRLVLAAALLLCAPSVHAGSVLDQIRIRQDVHCGVVTDQDDYSKEDSHGNLTALGADLCKAITAAALGAGAKVVVSAYPDEPSGLEALRSGKIDVLGGATPSLQNRAHYPVTFGPTVLYDGQGFLVLTLSPVKALKDLAGKQICYIGGTAADEALQPALKARDIAYIPFEFEEMGEMEAALVAGRCTAITGDVTQLANMRAAFLGQKHNYSILPELITADPVAPAYPAGDREWGAIVDWTVTALIQAEESGVTAANVEDMRKSEDPVVRRLLGTARGPVLALGLDQEWSVRAIKAAGNFGEIYDRDVGMGSPLKLARGMTALWNKGGALYPMPIR
jgi:general L-amino acid transport system substrate-binding protein